MIKLRIIILLAFFLSVFMIDTSAQYSTDKNFFNDEVSQYLNEVGNNAIIYSGKEQTKYPIKYRGNPYLEREHHLTGQICYDGVIYAPIKFRYDTYRDEIVVLTPNEFNIVLEPRLFDYAFADNLYIKKTAEGDQKPFAGYYVELYKSQASEVLEKTKCSIQEIRESNTLTLTFEQKKIFYILKDNVYHSVRKQKDVYNLFRDQKKELKRYAKSNSLNYKADSRRFLIELMAKYEQTGK